jgi:hypothetical protein
LTLDDDVQAKVEQEMRRTGKSLKATVNDLLRSGFLHRPKPARARKFRVQPHNFGGPPRLPIDNIGELLDLLDQGESK